MKGLHKCDRSFVTFSVTVHVSLPDPAGVSGALGIVAFDGKGNSKKISEEAANVVGGISGVKGVRGRPASARPPLSILPQHSRPRSFGEERGSAERQRGRCQQR